MTAPDTIAVRITRHYTAPAERVFDAWLDTTLIGQWMFGARLREEEILRIESDGRVGGRFSFLVRRDGNAIDHIGKYLEIDRPRRLVFTWGIAGQSDGESRVSIDIVVESAGCALTLTHTMDARWAEYRDRVSAGWTKMTGVLAEVLEEQNGADLS